MTREADAVRAARLSTRQAEVLADARLKVEEVKSRAQAAHSRTMKERNARVLQVNEALQDTIARVNAQHRAFAAQLRVQAIDRQVHMNVSRGLQSLEELVRLLRKTNVTEDKMMEAVMDPAMSGSFFDRERRASVSGLVQSVQRQLVQQYEFLNIAAHELRTPIMPILANAELLYDKVGPDAKELDAIIRNGLRLQWLAENILSVTKIESRTLRYQMRTFDLNRLLSQSVQDLEHSIRSKDVRVLFVPETESLMVTADQDKVEQVVVNLLDNALKFTLGGCVLVTSRSEGGLAEVSISDEGPGIDPEIYPLLFTRFTARSARGTGLGLYICRNLVESHGGTIWARNVVGQGKHGSVFTFVIPQERG